MIQLCKGNRFSRWLVALFARVLGLEAVQRADEASAARYDKAADQVATAAELMLQMPDEHAINFLRDALTNFRNAERAVLAQGGR